MTSARCRSSRRCPIAGRRRASSTRACRTTRSLSVCRRRPRPSPVSPSGCATGGWLPARPRAPAAVRRGDATSPGPATTAGFARGPRQGTYGRARTSPVCDAGLSFETTERSLLVPCANAPVDLLLVRPSDIPEYVQDGVVDVGITGANLVAEAGRASRHSPSSASRAARSRQRCRGGVPAGESRTSTVSVSRPRTGSTRRLLARARSERRARSGLGVGRGDAETRAGGCDRRPRLDRIDDGRKRLRPSACCSSRRQC